jgi:hypothetical protein
MQTSAAVINADDKNGFLFMKSPPIADQAMQAFYDGPLRLPHMITIPCVFPHPV